MNKLNWHHFELLWEGSGDYSMSTSPYLLLQTLGIERWSGRKCSCTIPGRGTTDARYGRCLHARWLNTTNICAYLGGERGSPIFIFVVLLNLVSTDVAATNFQLPIFEYRGNVWALWMWDIWISDFVEKHSVAGTSDLTDRTTRDSHSSRNESEVSLCHVFIPSYFMPS